MPKEKQSEFVNMLCLILALFAIINGFVDGASRPSARIRGLNSLDCMISRAQAIEAELEVSWPDKATDIMTLDICREVIQHSLQQLAQVQESMRLINLTVGQASSAEMAYSAASTYMKTCKQTLEEAGENDHGPFRDTISHLVAWEVNECTTSQVISQAISGMVIGISPTYKENRAHKYPIMGPASRSLLDTIPARRRLRVAKDGSGNFATINDAVKNVPTNQNEYFLISVGEGTFEEYVEVTADRPYIVLVGAGEGKTIITGKHSKGTGWGTFYSATLVIKAENFIGLDLTIENTAGPQDFQAVALLTSGNFIVFYHCTILEYQDTLYAHHGCQFFHECTIGGTVDFIFGDSSVVFQSCTILVRQPLPKQSITITASGRNCPTIATGISIHKSNIIAAPDLKNTTKTYLGRPWGRYARTAFMLSNLNTLIHPSGWLPFNGDTANVDYGEFQNVGLGADTSRRVDWTGYHKMDRISAYQFTVDRMLNGGAWIDNTSVPYTKGLF